MKKLLALALLLCQCGAPNAEIQPTSVDVEDFNEQVITLGGLPFDVVVDSDWELKSTSYEHQLWKNNKLEMTFSLRSELIEIQEGSTVIEAENPEITSFCLEDRCVIQVQEDGLYAAQALTEDAMTALSRLR